MLTTNMVCNIHYFNAGVRYQLSKMSECLGPGWKYAKDWDYNIWGTEQIIFNEMMYSENEDAKTGMTQQ